jgi:hypothetical protein
MATSRRYSDPDAPRPRVRGAVALARVKGPFGLRAEGIAALLGLAALCLLVLAGMMSPARAGPPEEAQIDDRIANAPGPWTVVDLGIARLEEHCTHAARLAFTEVARVHGADLLRRTAWTVELIGVNHGTHDAAISCTYAATTKTRALLMIHSKGDGVQAVTIARAIDVSFSRHVKRITSAWLRSLDG